MGNPSELKVGPCRIYFDSESLGFTMDNSVTIKSELNTFQVIPDQSGSAEAEYVTGESVSVEATLGETGRQQLAKLMIGGETMGDGGLAICASTGANLLQKAKELLLIPMDPTATDAYRASKAVPKVNMELVFSKEAVRTLPVKFTCFPDPTVHTHSLFGSGCMIKVEDVTT